ncbi:MAG TPA: hypothetical protein VK681_39210 [Reyranella sp.]|nr:hypothetical protein [Reyranella sp.]
MANLARMIDCLGGPLNGQQIWDDGRRTVQIERVASSGPIRFEKHNYERSGDLLLYVGRGR